MSFVESSRHLARETDTFASRVRIRKCQTRDFHLELSELRGTPWFFVWWESVSKFGSVG